MNVQQYLDKFREREFENAEVALVSEKMQRAQNLIDELDAKFRSDGALKLPDGVRIRYVADLSAMPQGKSNFSSGSRTLPHFKTIAIDYRAARRRGGG